MKPLAPGPLLAEIMAGRCGCRALNGRWQFCDRHRSALEAVWLECTHTHKEVRHEARHKLER